MKYLLVASILIIHSSCDRLQKPSHSDDMSTKILMTREALVSQLNGNNQVKGTQTSAIDQNYEVISAGDDEKFFIKDNRVVSSSRKPKSDERFLLHWRYFFKGRIVREQKVTSLFQNEHQLALREVACDELGMGVVYDPNHEQVVRVFYYAKK